MEGCLHVSHNDETCHLYLTSRGSESYVNHGTQLISAFLIQKLAIFVVLVNTAFLKNSFDFYECFNQHDYNFDDVSKVGFSRSFEINYFEKKSILK